MTKHSDVSALPDYCFTARRVLASSLNPAAKLVYIALTDLIFSRTRGGISRLAAMTGLSPSHVPDSIVELERGGWIQVVRRRGVLNRYVLMDPAQVGGRRRVSGVRGDPVSHSRITASSREARR